MINQPAAPGAINIDAEQERSALYGAALWTFLSPSLPLTKLTGAEPEQLAIELKLLGNNPTDEEIQTIVEAQHEALNMRQNLGEQMPSSDETAEQIRTSQKSTNDMKLMVWLNEQSLQANGIASDINPMLQSYSALSANVKAAIDPRLNDLHNALTNGLIKYTNGSYGLSLGLDQIKQLMLAIHPNINRVGLDRPTNELNIRRFFLELVRHEVNRHQANSTLIANSRELNSVGIESFANQDLDLPEIPEIPDVQFDVNNIVTSASSLDGLRSIWSEGREMRHLGVKDGGQFILDPEIISKYLQFERYINLNADHIVRVAQRVQGNQQLDKAAYISALLKKARASFNKVFLMFLLSQVAAKRNKLAEMSQLELELYRLLQQGRKSLDNLDPIALEITREGFEVQIPIDVIQALTVAADTYMPNDILRITAPSLDIGRAIDLSDEQSWDSPTIGFTKKDFLHLLNTEDLDATTNTIAGVQENKKAQLNNVVAKKAAKLFDLAKVSINLPNLELEGANLAADYIRFLTEVQNIYVTLPTNSYQREVMLRAVRLMNCTSVLNPLAKQNQEDLLKQVNSLDPVSKPELADLVHLGNSQTAILIEPSEDALEQVRELFLYETAVRKSVATDLSDAITTLQQLQQDSEDLLVDPQIDFALKIFTTDPKQLARQHSRTKALSDLANASFESLMDPLNLEIAKLPTAPEFIAYNAIATETAFDVDLPGFDRIWEQANTLILEEKWDELKSYLQTLNQLPLKSTKELIFQIANQLLSLIDAGIQLDQSTDVDEESQYKNAFDKLYRQSRVVEDQTISPHIVSLVNRLISSIPAADKYLTEKISGKTDTNGNKVPGEVLTLMRKLEKFPEFLGDAVKEFNLGQLVPSKTVSELGLLQLGKLSDFERYNLMSDLGEIVADMNKMKFELSLIEEKFASNIWIQRGLALAKDIETLIMLLGTFNTSAWKVFDNLTSILNPGEIVSKDTLEAALLVAKLHAETDNDFTFNNPVWEQRTLELLNKIPAQSTLAGLAIPFNNYVHYKSVSFDKFKNIIDELELEDEFSAVPGIIDQQENAYTVLSILSFDFERLSRVTKIDAEKALEAVENIAGNNDPFTALLAKLVKIYFG